jgi:phosphonate transport system permease protein
VTDSRTSPTQRPPEQWTLRQPFGVRSFAVALAVAVLLALSARHTEMDRLVVLSAEYVAHVFGLRRESQVARGVDRFVSTAFPLVIAEETSVSRIDGFDRAHLPLLSHLEMRETSSSEYDFAQQKMVEHTETREVLVRPIGYLVHVLGKMLESLEMALWATLLGIVLGAPIAYLGTRGYSPHRVVHALARGAAGFLRAPPEFVSALFLVLAFGFGPIAGVLALGLHSAGFFGKFYADDIENAERGPQEALASLGANKLEVLRFAALPQVLPQYLAYTQYVLERNVRMATVIGVVGAGGIGVELKGRFDTFDFGHVTTILLVIFLTVLALERISQWARARLM